MPFTTLCMKSILGNIQKFVKHKGHEGHLVKTFVHFVFEKENLWQQKF